MASDDGKPDLVHTELLNVRGIRDFATEAKRFTANRRLIGRLRRPE